MVDGELFLPEEWCDEEHTPKRNALGIPRDRQFRTKSERGWQMIKRAKAQGLPFEVLAIDAFYGKDRHFRAEVEAEQIL